MSWRRDKLGKRTLIAGLRGAHRCRDLFAREHLVAEARM